ncbi:hypothetical protein QBC34DRAFT_380525 [Podospora aff. communis PSN243]|uniref:Secreted protein n=1 Tax=Podospora aff. communis PSN243 TaxID=3040156 RepID=A0AAV9GLD6_9PEZI|nr:hypothetical protein QBC34DRAFT_380525 [Podospora aff. communis PSN243]
MQLSTLLLTLSAGLPSVVLAADTGIPGYTIVPISWSIEVSPGKVKVVAQAKGLNPDFKLRPVPAGPPPAPPAMRLTRREVKFCNNFGKASVAAIRDGVSYLRGVPGIPTNGPGPGACGRVSCSYNSAIYWCNDNNFAKSVTWDGIANSAYRITEVCPHTKRGSYPYPQVSGQNFELSKWNTLVKEEPC